MVRTPNFSDENGHLKKMIFQTDLCFSLYKQNTNSPNVNSLKKDTMGYIHEYV